MNRNSEKICELVVPGAWSIDMTGEEAQTK